MNRVSGLVTCVECAADIPGATGARNSRVYCSNACRQRAYRRRARPTSTDHGTVAPTAMPAHALDSFVGRKEELAALNRLFRQHRLVTLFGPAGAGKTRVAAEFVTAAAPMFGDGVHLVELAKTSAPGLVAQAVAMAARAAERPDTTITESIVSVLGTRQVLLVLDNCEHLADACGELVAELLHRCPHLRVLATSREILRLPGEKVFAISPLGDDDAVRLFADRAQSAAPAFALDKDNREVVRSICRRLDNLPLAVELSARLVRLMPLDYIAGQLEDRFTLLTSGARSADARHRSLHAAIDWSYSLLDADERVLLRRLSVLPGGFDFELAAVMSRDLRLPVIELISSLESKSLLGAATDHQGDPRFHQWESVRAYAHERLADSGELPTALERLVEALTTLATPLTECFTPPRTLVDRLLAEHENLQFAVDHLAGKADSRQPLLAGALARCRTSQGVVAEARAVLAEALRVPDAPAAHRVVALDEAAWSEAWQGNLGVALELADRGVRTADQVDVRLRCRALTGLAHVHQQLGDYPSALACFSECLDLLRETGDPHSIAMCGHNLAWTSILADDLATAGSALAEVLPLYEELQVSKASVSHTAGTLHLRRGDLVTAQRYYMASLSEVDINAIYLPYLVEGVGLTALLSGRPEHGLRLLGAAERLRSRTGAKCDEWWSRHVATVLADLRARRPTLDVDASLAEGRRVPDAASAIELALRHGAVVPGPRVTSITTREQQVAALVARGSTNVEIARTLHISERTVESHLDHVRTKLNLRSRAHVAAWVAQNLPAAR